MAAWSKGGETSTTSPPTRSIPASPRNSAAACALDNAPNPDGRAGAGRKGRIQPVDVEAEIDRTPRHPRLELGGNGFGSAGMNLGGIVDMDAEIVLDDGSDADMGRMRHVDQPLPDGGVTERAVVDPGRVVIGPGVGMGIDLDQRERPVFRRMRAQDRQRDGMIPPPA